MNNHSFFLPAHKRSRFSSVYHRLTLAGVGLAGMAFSLAAAQAQSTKIFVASFGNDTNDGSRGSPKRNFQAAHNAVAADGEIVVLDTAGYGALSISKALAVTVPPGVNGFITVSGNKSGVTIAAGPSDFISLRGLILEGGGTTAGGIGIVTLGGIGKLSIEDCTVRGFQSGVATRANVNSQLFMHGSVVRGCGTGLELGVANVAGISHHAVVTACRLERNVSGLFTFPGGTGSVDVTLADCTITGHSNAGIASNGTNSVVRVSNCTITGNALGVTSIIGGQLLSRGSNTLEKNNTANTLPGAYSAK